MDRGTADRLPRFGRYVPRFVIARGGMAEVFGAEATGEAGFSTWVALKRVLPHVSDDPRFSAMFLDEARLASQIRSAHVVPTLDLGRASDGTLFLVMELVVGATLATLTRAAIEAGAPLSVEPLVEILAQTAAGLDDAHRATDSRGEALGIVHRDVSPQNVLVGVDGRARIADFGVALARVRDTHSAAGETKGKRAFHSPEQAAGEALDARSDVFALGVVAWETLSGGAPRGRPGEPFPRLDVVQPERVSRPLAEVIAAALEPRREARPASARELADRLRAASPEVSARRITELVERHGADTVLRLRACMRGERTPATLPPPPPRAADSSARLRSHGTSFLAREGEVDALTRLVMAERLVSVFGPGGVGKTRLALEVARRVAGAFEETVFCELTDATSSEGLGFVLGKALGIALVSEQGASTMLESLGAALAQRGRCLVLLDNVEQVVEPLASALVRWLEVAPSTTFLCTSRERLRLSAESLYSLEPLAAGTSAEPGPAAQLFLDRARRVRPGFTPTEAEWAAIVEIATRLDGLPLAIELAAARARMLAPAELAAAMADRFQALGRGARDVAPRQATLDATIRWSWDLLDDPHERDTFLALSLCQGGFDLDAARAITGDPGAAEVVEALHDKSLFRAIPGTPRFGTYESIREFARRELAREPTRLAGMRDRHLAHFAERAVAWDAPDARAAVADVERELENLVAALRWAVEASESQSAIGRPQRAEQALALALAVEIVLGVRGPFSLLWRLLERTLSLSETTSGELRARVMLALARAEIAAGQLGAAAQTVAAAAALAQTTTSPRARGWAALTNAELAWQRGALSEVLASCSVAERAAESAGDLQLLARTSLRLANALVLRGDSEGARAVITRSRTLAQALGDRALEARATLAASLVAADDGDLPRARRLAAEATRLAEETGDRVALAVSLATEGGLSLEAGESALTIATYARAMRMLREAGQTRQEGLITVFVALAEEQAGLATEAEERCRHAIELNRASSNELMLGVGLAVLGRVLAERGALDEADAVLDEAVTILEALGAPFRYEVAHLCRGHVELARARVAEAEGRSEEAQGLRDAARQRARASRGRGRLLPGIEVRLALGRLEGALAALDEGEPAREEDPAETDAATTQEGIVVDVKRRAFQPPGGVPVSLATRASLWRLLAHLAEQRLHAPGRAFDVDHLFAIGWPGERTVGRSAASRVYVAMSTLRGLGLRDALERRSDGYLIRAEASLVLCR